MNNSRLNFDEILNSKNFTKKPNLFTINNLKDIANMSSKERKERILEFCTEEELNELDRLSTKNMNLDSSTIIEFAMDDMGLDSEHLSEKVKINSHTLKEILNGKIFPWKLEIDQVLNLLSTLNIPVNDFINGMREKSIIISNKDINISVPHLPRAKGLTKKQQYKAMVDMEKQILIQDEEKEREEFIQTLRKFVNL
ncbi:hypothetical protein [Ornithinibacillus contaminans]|uniref:hypothetical protein n=1 Tax=Ornithinibacillus contaminans TaxID=694055 RepID=UPI00064DF5C2|nr:hypothetical protein [Ornithinibacillus contaminans]